MHGVEYLCNTLNINGIQPVFFEKNSSENSDIFILSDSAGLYQVRNQFPEIHVENIHPEGYQLLVRPEYHKIIVAARDGVGAMYGLMTLADFVAGGNNLFDIGAFLVMDGGSLPHYLLLAHQ